MEFLTSPVAKIAGLALLVGLGLGFVIQFWGKLGKGTGGVTGQPAPPADPAGSMKPGTPTQPTRPPKEQV